MIGEEKGLFAEELEDLVEIQGTQKGERTKMCSEDNKN